MCKIEKLVMSMLVLVALVIGLMENIKIPVQASEGAINVLDYGAYGDDGESDRSAFSEALRAAGEADNGSQTEVYVPDGIYYLDGYIGIYSNTWLHLSEGAKIVRMDGYETEPMLIGVHNDQDGNVCYWNCEHSGYGQCVNVLISGGEWSGGVSSEDTFNREPSSEIISFRHADGIEIRDTVMGDTDGHHVINLDGVSNVLVEGVVFHDHMRNHVCGASDEDMKCREVIHTDVISPDHPCSTAYPLEDMHCVNVTVCNCSFDNCVSCVGTHNGIDALYLDGFMVKDCTFRDIEFHCINAVNFRGMQICGNKAENVSCFISAYGCTGDNMINGNEISCVPFTQAESCVDLCKGTTAEVSNNYIVNAGTYGISGANFGDDSSGLCNVTAKYNEIVDPGSCGIYVRDGCSALLEGNKITFTGDGNADRTLGIFVNIDEYPCTVSGNEITGAQYGIETARSSSVGIYGNIVSEADVYGISVYQSGNVTIEGCSLTGCAIGLQIDESTASVSDNLMSGNDKDCNYIKGSQVSGSTDDPVKTEQETAPQEEEPAASSQPSSKQETAPQEEEPAALSQPSSKKENVTEKKKQGRSLKQKVACVPVYRVFNLMTGEHFYTVSAYEREFLVNLGWRNEGIGWNAPEKSDTPVYRLYNPNGGEHHYTMSKKERDWLASLGWKYEGVGWYSDDNKAIPVYRHYHPKQRTGNHHYTMSKGESDYIVKYESWRYEGIGWYGAA